MMIVKGEPREPKLGEIRVDVRWTNAINEEGKCRGAIGAGQVRGYHASALVDTRAVRSVIPIQLEEQLGIQMRGQRLAQYADGRNDVGGVTGSIIFKVMARDIIEEASVLGDEALIGQTVLEKLDLLADCARQRPIPNPAHPDQPVSKVK